MHGMLSLAIIVTALVALAAAAGYVAVRLYRACQVAGVRREPADTAAGRPAAQ